MGIYDQISGMSGAYGDITKEDKDRIYKESQARLVTTVDLATLSARRDRAAREKVKKVIIQVIDSIKPGLNLRIKENLAEELAEDLHGYGPLDRFLDDPEVTEILCYSYDKIDIEKNGVVFETDASFKDAEHMMQVIERIVIPTGKRVDTLNPIVDTRLPDGSRVHAVIPDISVGSPTLDIRKFKKGVDLETLSKWDMLPAPLVEWFSDLMTKRVNTCISGGTGSGKTTFMSALIKLIPDKYVINLIEDPPEIDAEKRRIRRYQPRAAGASGAGEVTMYQLVASSLRERPDIIIVGECRLSETFAMLQAMNTGHAGSMTTVHANTTSQALNRLVSMASSSGELPKDQIPDFVAGSLELLIHISRAQDGSRKLVEIAEVLPETSDGRCKARPLVVLKSKDDCFYWENIGNFERSTFMSWQGMNVLPMPELGLKYAVEKKPVLV